VRTPLLLLPLVLLLASCAPSPEDLHSGTLPDRVDFNFHVKPILSDRCFTCHGPDGAARKADLRLDTEEGIRRVVRSGMFNRAELLHRVLTDDSTQIMPPRESGLALSSYEKAVLARWVRQGAEYRPHWAFAAPVKPALPDVRNAAWARNEIDRFVLARLERDGLQPSPEADRARLIRRLSYDLTGLPPSVEEVDRFLGDPSPDAYEKEVDRLLASSAYGERMASDWLDLARYTDSHGYQDDGIRHMWSWRDWVIRSFNDNMPYDRFVTWQVAGDLLPQATREQILATGFNRNHAQSAEGGIVDEEYRVEYVADRVTTVGRGLLGLSMDCARCHDHKYDPITQREYFQLFSFFNNVDEIGLGAIDGNNGPVLLLPDDTTERKLKALQRRIEEEERAVREYRTRIAGDPSYLQRAHAAPLDLGAGLVGHFTFDVAEETGRGEGQDTEQRIPNLADPDRPALRRGDPMLVPGRFGNAFEIREGAIWSVANSYAFDRSDPFSIALWVYPRKPQERGAVLARAADDNGGANRGFELNLMDGHVWTGLMHVRSDDAIRVQSRASVPLDRWTHLAVTYDGGTRASGLRVYVDGRAVPVDVLSDDLRRTAVLIRRDSTSNPLQIGGKRAGSEVATFEGRIDELRIYDRPLAPGEIARLADRASPAEESPADRLEAYLQSRDPAFGRLSNTLRASRAEETRLQSGIPDVMVMRERITPRPTFLLERGAYDAPAERVEPGTPTSVLSFPDSLPRDRLGLARWLFAPENPLTARVAVNRYWQMLFGAGLVRTPDDFGNQGELPTHPELLDWLAVTFRESGWDARAMVKTMVMSATYRQSSRIEPGLMEKDPENRLLARGPSHRLPAEMLRDGALAASGLLVREVGGASVKPYQPDGLWEEKSAGRGALRTYEQDTGDALYRRSLYTFWKLSSPPPMLVNFDASERNVCILRRPRTNTPTQALGMLNDPQFVEAARLLAERMMREGGSSPAERLRHGFRLVTARQPTPAELDVLLSLHRQQGSRFSAEEGRAARLLQVGERPADARLPAQQLAAYAMVANTLLNLDEFVMKR
jgi:hypothetical protein